ncbi:MFS transporter [Serratia ficaria]|uniref:MFS transporter n=1 Tax=Serratia ficaria TaxID=61651 RepID=UPI00217C520D|nr:MFS transporter [Serratia ficaria]CAI1034415.1 Inner membrane transport protein ydhP [Serratia ficaria]CAI1223112.1 Inner membrane transport protein ydhP [Serratia ficaria]CAI2025285.1 Inner membrane transport protein ydhP [Serratia ficaria]CAI2429348.1 Inner membrane transport protein ydhP [Serratia ficaria]CAI2495143.1 Inner membrane transport protein ydhP [Serratia ficaria]
MAEPKISIRSGPQSGSADSVIPFAVYVLGFGIFAMVTSEFQVSGMITVMAVDLGVNISQIGYLVSIYAFAMAFGGPLLAMALLRTSPKKSLMFLYIIFIGGESLGALSQSYYTLAAARLITGAVSGAFFGTALAICVQLVAERQRGWATSLVLAGIMVGTVLGLPMANLIGAHLGWRESFWATAILATLAALVSIFTIPSIPVQAATSLRSELAALKNPKLWAVFSTSLLIIGATFAAFTYFIPILKSIAGFGDTSIAILLFVYGVATVIGNMVVGKLADRHTIPTLAVGLCLLTFFLTIFGAFTTSKSIASLSLIGIGLVGVTMNPAMVSRVMRTANGRPLVNTIHTSVITMGIVIGAFLGGIFISAGYGPRAPLWVGVGMALLGLITLIPEIRSSRSPANASDGN